jgi:hypothetical protein
VRSGKPRRLWHATGKTRGGDGQLVGDEGAVERLSGSSGDEIPALVIVMLGLGSGSSIVSIRHDQEAGEVLQPYYTTDYDQPFMDRHLSIAHTVLDPISDSIGFL